MAEEVHQIGERREGLRPPRFGTRAMLLYVAIIAILLSASLRLGPAGAIALCLLAMGMFAHVAGNAIGKQLRDNGSRPLLDDEDDEITGTPPRSRQRPAPSDFAPTTELGERRSLGTSMWLPMGIGASAGVLLGGSLLAAANWQQATISNIAFGAVSCGVLGGLLGFVAGSFIKVVWSAWSQAHSDGNK